jgi:UDP-glucose 4-epimerase
VTAIDNFATGSRAALAGLETSVRVCELDLSRSDRNLTEVLAGADCVFHLAALASVAASLQDPLMSHDQCATTTVRLLEAAHQAGVRRVVYSSSCAVYGNQPELPWRTCMLPVPMSVYAAAKLSGEYYLSVFNSLYGLETVSLRYFNVYGPGQRWSSPYAAVIPRFIHAIQERQPLVVYGDGCQTRDFVHISDVVEANLRALNCPSPAVINVGSGTQTSILDLVALLGRHATIQEVKFEKPRGGEVRHSQAEVGESRRLLGFSPRMTLEDGLCELLHQPSASVA